MLTIWGRKTSSNVQAVMWCVGELGLAYERHDVGHIYGGTDTDAFFELNPNRKVPVLRDGDGPALWESGAILRYLANRYAAGPFWPEDPFERADVDRWAEWSKINVGMTFSVPVFWAVVRTPAAKRDPEAIKAAVAAVEEALALADARLGRHAFLVGDALSLADIQFGHLLYRYYTIEIERADLPNLAAYYQRLTARPAYQEHVMVSYEALRE